MAKHIDVDRLLHHAHLRFQQAALAADAASRNVLACPEQRDCRFRYQPKQWLIEQRNLQLQTILTGKSARFWSAYLDTIVYMTK